MIYFYNKQSIPSILLFWGIISIINSCLSQPSNTQMEMVRISNLEEFMDLFNNKIPDSLYWNLDSGVPITKKEYVQGVFQSDSVSHDQMLKFLFDKDSFTDFPLDSIKSFLKIAKKSRIDFYDEDWFAQVELQGVYKDETTLFYVTLQNEQPQKSINESSWVITGAQTNFLEIPGSKEKVRGIPPGDHNLNFLSLVSMTQDSSKIGALVSKNYSVDQTSLLLNALSQGDLIIKGSTKVSFYFMQVEGWVFRVDHFNPSEGIGGGWKISELIRNVNLTLSQFRQSILDSHE